MQHRTKLTCGTALLLSLMLLLDLKTASAEAPIIAFSSGPANVVISRDGKDYLSFGTAVWGPNWSWAGVDGTTEAVGDASVANLKAKLGPNSLALNFRATRVASNRLQLNYELKADSGIDLTLFVVELRLGKAFDRADAVIDSGGKTNVARLPFGRGDLGNKVSSLQVKDGHGGQTVLRFEPACEIGSDGAARIVLAKDHLAAGARTLSITVDLPQTMDWYPSVSQLPDEPGIGTWYPWRGTGATNESLIGLEDWIEQPAGKHGRITRAGDKLIYHQQPIKLWGLNLCYGTCAPDKALADKRATFYRKEGINVVRFHKFADNSGWAGIQAKDSCTTYDPAGLDRMDYQIAKLKESGIYIELSAHFGSLKLSSADKQYVPFLEEFGPFREGRIETPHSALFYSPDLQTAHIQQMVNLLKHTNTYTGLTYAQEPAIAFIEIINEQSILFYTSMQPLKASATLRKQVASRFCEWLRSQYGSQEKLAQAWGPAAFDCFTGDGFAAVGENLDKANILPLGNPWYWDPEQIWGSQSSKRRRLLDTLKFLYTLESEFYDRYVKAVRNAGYAGELVGSNWQAGRGYSHFANLHADARVGTIDRHNYFGGDQANATLLARAGSGILSSGMQQVAGRPFMLSEWIHVFPSEFGVEGPALIGAYGMGLQGWDVSFMFQNGDNGSYSDRIGRDQWDVTAPQILGLFPAVARQIFRNDVSESDVTAIRRVHLPSLFQGELGFDDKVAQGYDVKELDSSKVPARAMAAVKNVVQFTGTSEETPVFDLKSYEHDGEIVSATGQLHWREGDEGACTINTAGTKAFIGFAQTRHCDLGSVSIEPQSRYSAIYVTARERDKTIDTSLEILVIALARARNTGMKFSPPGDRMLTTGHAPILMEPVKATLSFRKNGSPSVYVLDHDGRMTGDTLPIVNGQVIIDGARDKTPYYLIRY